MASEVEIGNLALVRIGTASRITSLDDDRTAARTLKAVFAAERQATIRDGSWNFAGASDALAAVVLDSGVPYPWTYAYRLPAACLRLIEVQNDTARGAYELQGRVILTDAEAPLYVRYLQDVAELALWDAAAVEAFAVRLAWRCGPKIAGASFDVGGCWAEYRALIAGAKRVDALENPGIMPDDRDDSWLAARAGAWR